MPILVVERKTDPAAQTEQRGADCPDKLWGENQKRDGKQAKRDDEAIGSGQATADAVAKDKRPFGHSTPELFLAHFIPSVGGFDEQCGSLTY